ncbi:MarR family transcriptional regulator [Actinomadura sp. NPDC000600]|uniref:MarR family winged helix-turn-helix transcriptional regulator n=1 Tax=Actinomadura sp. NPDC000600 TaxID=3154262 RepID=UPI00339A90E8
METDSTAPELAMALALATARLRARLRSEQAEVTTGQTMSQLSVLGRVSEAGTTTASELAKAEHVRQQSIAETVSALKRQGLLAGRPDPSDGRKALLSLTEAGEDLVRSIVEHRGAWLARALDAHVTPAERAVLAQATHIMFRLADCAPLGEVPPVRERDAGALGR